MKRPRRIELPGFVVLKLMVWAWNLVGRRTTQQIDGAHARRPTIEFVASTYPQIYPHKPSLNVANATVNALTSRRRPSTVAETVDARPIKSAPCRPPRAVN